MEWGSKLLHSFPGEFPLPFFMAYPGYPKAEQERRLLQDLEYLQMVFPNDIKGYQRKIAEMLDKVDYEGSMIYDEYPDRLQLQKLAAAVVKSLQNDHAGLQEEEQFPAEKWIWLEEMILVLLCQEIYKRRHGGPRGFLKL